MLCRWVVVHFDQQEPHKSYLTTGMGLASSKYVSTYLPTYLPTYLLEHSWLDVHSWANDQHGM
jgi:hypothetical protein